MNGQEQATLNGVAKDLKDHMKVSDKRWDKVEPMVKAHYDQIVVNKFVELVSSKFVSVLKLVALIIGILISLKIISGIK